MSEAEQTIRGDRFVVLAPLGQGAQGQTFDGYDRLRGQPVAIKRFDVRGATAWKDVELAEREARVLQSLAHPRLPRYVDHFEENGALYLVMEKMEGESLAALRARGASLSEDDVLRLLRDAGEVLDYLHGRAPAVIHRDIKPGNVIRRPDGSFAFVDFGAVRDKLRPEGGSTVVGTFGYMAPEQFQGRALPASDVYAVGATALTMLTGRQPEDLPHRGLAIDVRAALRGRASERMTRILEALLQPDPDRRASRIAGVAQGRDSGRARPPAAASTRDGREAEEYERRSRVYAEGRARRQARRQARREAWLARRETRWRRGVPFPFSLVLAIVFAAGTVGVTMATQVLVPLVLTVLSVFFARRALRSATVQVRNAGQRALDEIDRSRQWFLRGQPGQGGHVGEGPGARVGDAGMRVEAPGGPAIRVADDDESEAPASPRGVKRAGR